MSKVHRAGYVFLTWKGDHGPRHVHVYRGGRLVLKWDLVSRISDSLHKSRSAAPGSQGATTDHIGNMRGRSNAARRDAPPGNYVTTH